MRDRLAEKLLADGRSFLLVTAAAIVLMACSPTIIDARVTRASRPVEGVEVSMDCPQLVKASGPSLFGKTDASGHLEFREPSGGRWIHDGCDIVVGPRRFPVKSVCVEYSGNHCVRVAVSTDLADDHGRSRAE